MIAQALQRKPIRIQAAGNLTAVFWIDSLESNALMPVAALEQRRAMELEADKAAVYAMSQAGLDPTALLNYIQRLQPPDRAFSPFPPRDLRIAALLQAVLAIPPVN